MRKTSLVALAALHFLAASLVLAQTPTKPFAQLDQHALKAPSEAEQSLEKLAEYLVKPAKNDREKARVIFRWITDRIAYDAEGYLTGKRADTSAAGALKGRKVVCAGYANLFLELAKRADLEAAIVSGPAKNSAHAPGKKLERHAWNAVKIDGRWQLLDCTWSAGGLNAKKQYQKNLDEFYFLTPPEHFIFSHFPADAKWQLLDTPVSFEQFEKWPRPSRALFALKVPLQDLQTTADEEDFQGWVKAHFHASAPVRLHSAPLDATLKAGTRYRFKIESASAPPVIVSNGKPVAIPRKGNLYETDMAFAKGKLQVSIKLNPASGSYVSVLEYVVE